MGEEREPTMCGDCGTRPVEASGMCADCCYALQDRVEVWADDMTATAAARPLLGGPVEEGSVDRCP